jgi:TonB family protein
VLVGPGKGAAGSLDLSKFDQALAGKGTGASATAGGAGGAAKGQPGAGQAGGTGQGGAGTGGQGQGGAGGTGGAGGAGGAGGYRVVWDQPDASKGRELLSAPKPKVPAWVSTQGLTLSITIAFVLLPDGVVSGVSLAQSSGYADVDSAIIDAIRRWRFTPAKGAGQVKGLIPYVIKSK